MYKNKFYLFLYGVAYQNRIFIDTEVLSLRSFLEMYGRRQPCEVSEFYHCFLPMHGVF